jgi:hypothetical protein
MVDIPRWEWVLRSKNNFHYDSFNNFAKTSRRKKEKELFYTYTLSFTNFFNLVTASEIG